jgi:hypothetical protein
MDSEKEYGVQYLVAVPKELTIYSSCSPSSETSVPVLLP